MNEVIEAGNDQMLFSSIERATENDLCDLDLACCDANIFRRQRQVADRSFVPRRRPIRFIALLLWSRSAMLAASTLSQAQQSRCQSVEIARGYSSRGLAALMTRENEGAIAISDSSVGDSAVAVNR